MNINSLVRKEVAGLNAYRVEDTRGVRVKLDAMENPYPLPYELRKELNTELATVPLNRYPDPEATGLKAEIAEWMGVGPERLILGNGSDELIGMLATTFGGPDGKVAYFSPSFAMYNIIARALGRGVVELPLTHTFEIDFDGSLKIIADTRPELLFIAYPNNPTGNLFDREIMNRLIAGFMGIVVVDEAYFSFSGESVVGLVEDNPNLVVLRTLSKIGLAGLRVGAMAASQDILEQVNKVRLPYNINALSQCAATVILRNRAAMEAQVAEIVKERERLYIGLDAMSGVTAFPSSTNFIMFRLRGASEVFAMLRDKGILIKNLDSPGALKDCLRVTVGTPEENDEFLRALKEVIS